MITKYLVTGMSCGHCENAVRQEVSQIPGVQRVEVAAATGHMALTWDGPVNDTAVLAAVEQAGYAATRQ